jgi:hypothetical protein
MHFTLHITCRDYYPILHQPWCQVLPHQQMNCRRRQWCSMPPAQYNTTIHYTTLHYNTIQYNTVCTGVSR